jgi:hypothetical protein
LLSIRNISKLLLISMNNKLFLFYTFQIWWRINTLVICRGITVSHPLYQVRFAFASLAVTGTVKWSVHAMNFATLHVRQVNPKFMHSTKVICPVWKFLIPLPCKAPLISIRWNSWIKFPKLLIHVRYMKYGNQSIYGRFC